MPLTSSFLIITTIYYTTRSSGHFAPLLLAPAEGLGALRALLGAFCPLLSSRIQKYTLRWLFGHLTLQNLSIIKIIQDSHHFSKVAASNSMKESSVHFCMNIVFPCLHIAPPGVELDKRFQSLCSSWRRHTVPI